MSSLFKIFSLVALVTLFLIAFSGGSASAAVTCTKYASLTGSDTTGNGTTAAPYRTPQKLVDNLFAGDTGCLRAGTYTISSNLRFPRAGTSTGRITLASEPGARAKLSGGYVYVVNGSNFVTISDLDINGAAANENAVQIHAADTIFERNDLQNHATGSGPDQSCIHAGSNAGWGQALRPIIRENKIHDCGDPAAGNKDHAIYYENVSGGETVDNLFWSSAAFAIHLYPNAQGHRIAHNVIDSSGWSGVIFAGEGSLHSSNNIVEQNVVSYNNRYAGETYLPGTGNVARNNCIYQNPLGGFVGVTQTGNVTADPAYLDRPNRDYRMSLSSACLPVVGYDTARKLEGAPTDTTPPDTTISAGPTGDTYATTVSFSFTATETATFECRVDGGTWAACTSPKSVTVGTGSHTFEVRATDTASNVDPTPASRTWNVLPDDTSAPSVTWTVPTAGGNVTGQLNETNANCRVDATDDLGVQRVDFYLDGTFLNSEMSAPYSCIWDTSTATSGSHHSLTAVAFDAAGNADAASVRVTRTP